MQLVPCDTLAPEAVHAAFTSAFSDYLAGPFELTLERWRVFLARHGADFGLSRAAVEGGAPVAFALVNARTDVQAWRLAGMGATPAARGTGAAQRLLDDMIERASGAGMRSVELECFAQNERALRLYRSRGFEVAQALWGYVREAGSPPLGETADARVDDLQADAAFDFLDALARRLPDLPYQVTGRSLREGTSGTQALRSGDAMLCFGPGAAGALVVHSLIDTQPGQRNAEALVARLGAMHPAAKIVVPQLQRRDLGGEALERLGFAPMPLDAVLMRKKLPG